MAAEVVVGIAVNSLALLSDAAHMLTDAGALALALVAMRLAAGRRAADSPTGSSGPRSSPPRPTASRCCCWRPGWLRGGPPADPPAGGVRACRSCSPPLAGIAVNLVAAWLVAPGRPAQPQRRGRLPAHPHRPVRVRRDRDGRRDHPGHRLRPGRPDRLAARRRAHGPRRRRAGPRQRPDPARGGARPAWTRPGSAATWPRYAGVVEVHDLHVWEITSGSPALSAHVIVAPALDCHRAPAGPRAMLRERYGLTHTTLQVDHAQPTLHTHHRSPR